MKCLSFIGKILTKEIFLYQMVVPWRYKYILLKKNEVGEMYWKKQWYFKKKIFYLTIRPEIDFKKYIFLDVFNAHRF